MSIEVTSATLRAHPKQALSSFHSSAAGTWSFIPMYTTTSLSSSWSRPRNICSACLSRWHLPRRSPPFIAEATSSSSVGSQAHPKLLASVANRWADTEFKVPSSSGMVKANDDGLAFNSSMLKSQLRRWNHVAGNRAGRRGGARVSTIDCARSPYGESTFKRNRPSLAVLMVLGRGGGGVLP